MDASCNACEAVITALHETFARSKCRWLVWLVDAIWCKVSFCGMGMEPDSSPSCAGDVQMLVQAQALQVKPQPVFSVDLVRFMQVQLPV